MGAIHIVVAVFKLTEQIILLIRLQQTTRIEVLEASFIPEDKLEDELEVFTLI